MKMIGIRLNSTRFTCENCGSNSGDWGIVSKLYLKNIKDKMKTMTNLQILELLLFEKETGIILCQKCLDEKIGRQGPDPGQGQDATK